MTSSSPTMEERLGDLLQADTQRQRLSAVALRHNQRRSQEATPPHGHVRENNGEVHFYYPPVVPPPEPERFVIEEDLEGYETCPDPLKAGSTEEFVDLLGRYRLWAGSPSFREMQRRCRGAAAASTFCKMLKKPGELPAQHLVRAFIQGCAGDDQAVKRWITAWRRLQVSLVVNA